MALVIVQLVAVQLVEQPAGQPAGQQLIVHHVTPVVDEHAAVAVHVAVVQPWPVEDQLLGPGPCDRARQMDAMLCTRSAALGDLESQGSSRLSPN